MSLRAQRGNLDHVIASGERQLATGNWLLSTDYRLLSAHAALWRWALYFSGSRWFVKTNASSP